ncbi:MAG: AsmA-like C-terminal region-containing protein [Paracoccaceae bacterium]
MSDEIPRPKKRTGRRRRRFGIWMLLTVAFLFGLLGLAGLSVTGRSLTAPDWMTEQAVTRVNANLGTGRVSLGRMVFQVDESGIPRLLLRDLGIFDARGAEIARLNEVGARFSLASMLRGEFEPEVLRLNGAQVTVRRRPDGQFDLSFGTGSGASGTLPDVLDAIERVFASSLLVGVELIEAGALTITVEDARSGRFWQVTEGRLQVQQDPTALDFSIAFDVFNGTEDLARTVLGIHTDKRDSSASVGATFENAAAADIALQSPALSFLGVLDAPISGAVRADFGATGALLSLVGSLEIAAGALQPTEQTKPIGFESGKAYFRYNPALEQIQFSEVTVVSEAGRATGSGRAYLRDFVGGWPSTLLGQFALSNLEVEPEGLFADPVGFAEGAVDFRMRLSPFHVDIGQFVLSEGDERLQASGTVTAGKEGWEASVDAKLNHIDRARLLTLWPVSVAPKTRDWFEANVSDGRVFGVDASIRVLPAIKPRIGLEFEFSDATIRYLKTLPEISGGSGYASLHDSSFSVALEAGAVAAPAGGRIDLGGTTYRVEDTTQKPPRAALELHGSSAITGALSILHEPPFNILRNSPLPVDLAEGRANFHASVGFEVRKGLKLPDIDFDVAAELRDVLSDVVVKGRRLTAPVLNLVATPKLVEIGGPMRLGAASLNPTWRKIFGPDEVGKSQVSGSLDLDQSFLDEFSIGLPSGAVSGRGVGDFELQLEEGQPPRFSLDSDLKGIGLQIAALGWSKAASERGALQVAGTLGPIPQLDRIEISAQGLKATGGRVQLSESGQLQTAAFERVEVGGWLDAPVTLTGRGAGVVPAVSVQGGTIDVRNAALGSGGGQARGGPIQLALDRLIVSEGITLTGLTGDFDGAAGFGGTFSGRVNGGAVVAGRLAPARNGSAIRIQSNNAGGVLRDAGVFKNGVGGVMDLTLRPRQERGVYVGRLSVTNTRVVGAPALTEILSAISVVGLLDQVNGPGISFNQVDAEFRLSPRSVTLTRSSATGPSLGVSLDGVYDLRTKRMNMQGVLSPVYFLNGIGQIFSRRGEGLFGFTFRLMGAADAPQVSVNPLSILTPGMFREIFRRPPPTPQQ